MTGALASKVLHPCRGKYRHSRVSKLSSFMHRPQSIGNCRRKAHHIERSFRFRNFREALTFVQEIGELAEAEGHHPNIKPPGWATQPSRCKPRRSKDCMRTTSSWPPRSIAYSLARPRSERVLLVLEFAPLFRCRARSSVCSRLRPQCDSAPRGGPPQDRHGMLMCFKREDNHPGCSQQRSTFYVRLQSTTSVASRPAKIGDELVTTKLNALTGGFAGVQEPTVASVSSSRHGGRIRDGSQMRACF